MEKKTIYKFLIGQNVLFGTSHDIAFRFFTMHFGIVWRLYQKEFSREKQKCSYHNIEISSPIDLNALRLSYIILYHLICNMVYSKISKRWHIKPKLLCCCHFKMWWEIFGESFSFYKPVQFPCSKWHSKDVEATMEGQ